jgi:hypothetical protein
MNTNTTKHGNLTADFFRRYLIESEDDFRNGEGNVYKHIGELRGIMKGACETLEREQKRVRELEGED